MIYVMSDLHGEYDKYLAMLKKIKFSPKDELYILGDVVDRGSKPVEILQDMRSRENVIPLMGNHDKMAVDVLTWLLDDVNESTLYKNISEKSIYDLMVWRMNGAQTTIDGFYNLPKEERAALLDYMKKFAPYEVVKAGGKTFILLCDDLERDYGDTDVAEKCAEECREFGFETVSMRDEFETIYGDTVEKEEEALEEDAA